MNLDKEHERVKEEMRAVFIEDEFEICTGVIDTLDNIRRFKELIEHELPFKVNWYIRNKESGKIID